ncbi:hypothetical protein N7519_007721 [Penicillium mononematosum]|uniref:uncharacterized protein n=1 Tax=Penicillium mononematosum TaxID=268346 RepID=UPI002547157C|nr:uncharacterized protein N7519_007721 [Penicillium mononematosum]KAJ6186420.1 hypothetical protein N7519_007721 [Penicillium mononematosum]
MDPSVPSLGPLDLPTPCLLENDAATFTVGEVSQQECGNCLQNDGPWAKCVRYHDIDPVFPACGNFVERLEEYVHRMQAELGLHDSQTAAIHNAIMAENLAELVVPARAFIPTTADDHQAQFNRMLSMINSVKEQLVNILRT